MYCTTCGCANREATRFCTTCGMELDTATTPETVVEGALGCAPPVEDAREPARRVPWLVLGVGAAALTLAGIGVGALLATRGGDAEAAAPPTTVTVRETSTLPDALETAGQAATAPAPPVASPPDPIVRDTSVIGYSVEGRRIVAIELGESDAPRTIVVIGCVHGDECSGVELVRYLKARRPPEDVHAWLIPNVNPDGLVRRTRQNANGVDLNRNSPFDWQELGSPGERQYSGTGPESEPETRAILSFLARVRPDITYWFHQRVSASRPPLIDESGGRIDLEARYASLVGLPLDRKPRYPGSLASWSNHRWPGTTAFVIELPGERQLSSAEVRRHATAVYALTRGL